MKIDDLRVKAKGMGVKTSGMSKTNLIRRIQQAQGELSLLRDDRGLLRSVGVCVAGGLPAQDGQPAAFVGAVAGCDPP